MAELERPRIRPAPVEFNINVYSFLYNELCFLESKRKR